MVDDVDGRGERDSGDLYGEGEAVCGDCGGGREVRGGERGDVSCLRAALAGQVEAADLDEGGGEGFDAEELRAAMLAGEVGDGEFDHLHAGAFEHGDEFDADGAAGGAEGLAGEERAADEAEIAVDVAEADAEEEAGELVVNLADEDAVPGVVTFEFVAVDEADVWGEGGEEEREFADVVLAVAVGVEEEILGGGGETGAEGAAVAAVDLVGDDPELGAVLRLEIGEDGTGGVGTAVVDDDDFEVRGEGGEGGEGVRN